MASASVGGINPRARAILTWWFGPDFESLPREAFRPACTKLWFMGGKEADDYIKEHFGGELEAVAQGRLDPWIEHPYNALAAVVVMDQFSRNAYRGTPRSFALDAKALTWSKHLLDTGRCDALPPLLHHALWLPFMHSENLEDQKRGVALYKAQAEEAKGWGEAAQPLAGYMQGALGAAVKHLELIEQWGRFPHRNAVLGRQSTPEEEAGLKAGTIAKF